MTIVNFLSVALYASALTVLSHQSLAGTDFTVPDTEGVVGEYRLEAVISEPTAIIGGYPTFSGDALLDAEHAIAGLSAANTLILPKENAGVVDTGPWPVPPADYNPLDPASMDSGAIMLGLILVGIALGVLTQTAGSGQTGNRRAKSQRAAVRQSGRLHPAGFPAGT